MAKEQSMDSTRNQQHYSFLNPAGGFYHIGNEVVYMIKKLSGAISGEFFLS